MRLIIDMVCEAVGGFEAASGLTITIADSFPCGARWRNGYEQSLLAAAKDYEAAAYCLRPLMIHSSTGPVGRWV